VLLLTGPEPDMRWRAFTREVLDLAVELGAHTLCGLGAYPMTVPHTRPSRLAATSPDPELVRRLALEQGTVDLPAGITSLLEQEAHLRGLTALTLWAQVPHYAASMTYPGASLALLDGLRSITGVHVAGEAARAASVTTRARISELVSANSEHVAMLQQLEEQYDATQRVVPPGPLPSGDELAAELERFLRDQRD
jgi:predicted ATP-grasp superfamily ATP-dependent carboligase